MEGTQADLIQLREQVRFLTERVTRIEEILQKVLEGVDTILENTEKIARPAVGSVTPSEEEVERKPTPGVSRKNISKCTTIKQGSRSPVTGGDDSSEEVMDILTFLKKIPLGSETELVEQSSPRVEETSVETENDLQTKTKEDYVRFFYYREAGKRSLSMFLVWTLFTTKNNFLKNSKR
eukprot:TRINITY_DN1022_c0_g3_i2.p1 TRINITY_DN1022_c0_g3~~TRINITY_DN1022_c0_g3_i2.p1  ORF type:complete len:179 (+),score=32.06 TRINITY_DN1022_c0_g3_i2:71-607(+)